MHYGIIAIGSRGDVQPYIALALGLTTAGHQTTLAAHENFRELAEDYGLAFHPLYGDVETLLSSPDGQKILKTGNAFTLMKYLRKSAHAIQKQMTRDILAACANADVLVTSVLGVSWVASIAERDHKPWAIVQLSFPITPTRAFPFAGLAFADFHRADRRSGAAWARRGAWEATLSGGWSWQGGRVFGALFCLGSAKHSFRSKAVDRVGQGRLMAWNLNRGSATSAFDTTIVRFRAW